MDKNSENWEHGIRDDIGVTQINESPVIIGEKSFKYSVSGLNWGNIPKEWSYKEATSVAVDSSDNVFVFNRGTIPVIVFNSEGEVINTWGEGKFTSPHAITITPDNEVFCVDVGDHTVKKFTKTGELLISQPDTGEQALEIADTLVK